MYKLEQMVYMSALVKMININQGAVRIGIKPQLCLILSITFYYTYCSCENTNKII